MPPGRKPKLTDELQEQLCQELAKGKTVKGACGAVGLGERTYYDWIEKGKTTNRNDKWCKFLNAVEIAKAKGQSKFEDVIYENAIEKGIWTCAAWYLERRDKEHYSKSDEHAPEAQEVEITNDEVEWINNVSNYNSGTDADTSQ